MSKVVNELHQIQADAYALYLKFHNYHWNVKGLQFFSVHEYTEEAYKEMSEIFDDIAERALQIGGKTLVTNSELMKQTKIEEEPRKDFTVKEVLEYVEKEYKYLLKAFKNLSKAAEEEGDAGTLTLSDDKIAEIEKRLWMLDATLG